MEQEGSSGGDLELVCPIYTVPGVGVDWEREGGDLPAKSSPTADNGLRIPSFSVDDEGVYYCKADVGGTVAFGYVSAVLEELEEVIQVFLQSSSTSVELGGTVTFTCVVEVSGGWWETRGVRREKMGFAGRR